MIRQMFSLALLSLLFVGCVQTWIPLEQEPRAAVAKGSVQFLEYPPTRPHKVIGIITPQADEYETEAEAVKAMRGIAAKHGADAIYIESQSEMAAGALRAGLAALLASCTSELRQSSGDNHFMNIHALLY